MAIDRRVQYLVDQIVESGRSAEEVCSDCPGLLPKVRLELLHLRRMEQRVNSLFPPSSADGAGERPPRTESVADLPRIVGYDVQEVLGRGGIGIVYKAWHLQLNRPVALKMLLSGVYARPQELERFHREAEAIAALHHPNIVQVHDFGEHAGSPYFTMEFVEGGNLARKLSGVPQPPRQTANLLMTLANAIHAAHLERIVHRDLKPANVLLTADGTPKLSDFGLACRLTGDAGLTQAGASLGTPSYMAPEQARGDKAAIGPATDVYALGAILYEMLTGRPPFRGETSAATLQQLMSHEPVPPAQLNPRVPRDLQTICLKCLQKAPSRRYVSAVELAADLRRFQGGEPISARPVGTFERTLLWLRRHPSTATAFAAALVLTITFATAGAWWYRESSAAELDAKVELRQAVEFRQKADYANASAALDRAKRRLGSIGAPSLRATLDEESSTVELLRQLDEIHIDRAVVAGQTGLSNALLNSASPEEAEHLAAPHGKGIPSARYADVFRLAGIGSPGDDPARVAARVRASPARQNIVAALDDWAAAAVRSGEQRWILSVLNDADADAWRDRVRDPTNWNNADALQKLADEAPVEQQPPEILVLLSARLRVARRDARPLMTRVTLAYPTDFWANVEMGNAVYQHEPLEAIGYYRAALLVRPRLPSLYGTIGVMYGRKGRWSEAIAYHQQAIRLDPAEPMWHYNYGWSLFQAGRHAEGISQLRESARLDATFDRPHVMLSFALDDPQHREEALEEARRVLGLGRPELMVAGHARVRQILLEMGRDVEARDDWRQTLEAYSPPSHDRWFGYAELCLFLGDEDGYRRARTDLLGRFGDSKDPTICERTAKACLLLDGERAELQLAAGLADRAEAAERPGGHEGSYPYDVFAQGLAAYRLGRFDEAIRLMKGKAAPAAAPCPQLVTAMSLNQTGERDQACKVLSDAVASFDWNKGVDANDREEFWVAHILRREAESLILPNQTSFRIRK